MTAPTDALEAELKRLRAENAVLRETLDAVDGGVLVYDSDGRYRFGNDLYHQAFPHLPAEDQLVGRRYEDILAMSIDAGTVTNPLAHADRAGFIASRARELMDRSGPSSYESHDPETGTWSLVRVRFTPTGNRVALRVDTTELKRLQHEVLRAQRMETIGRISGGVAHDFNNLLTVIISNLETLLDCLDDPGSRTLADGALAAAGSGSRLVRQLLTFARRDVTNPLVHDANALLAGMRDLLQRAVGPETVLELRLDTAGALACFDAAQFEAAVMNLVLNARDALAGPARAGTARRITLATRIGADGDIEIAISDAGSGMHPQVAAEAFEPFFTTKEPGTGSGLGLAQVWGFATGAGGSAAIESAPGQGTTVVIRLPAADATLAVPEEPAPEPAAADPTPGCTVLVVEDDDAVLTTSEMILRHLGYEVLTAADPRDALALLQGPERIDILFSDISMPGGINGFRLAAEARACRPGIRLLLTSGYPAGAMEPGAGQADVPDILPKPYRRDELQARLQLLLAQPV